MLCPKCGTDTLVTDIHSNSGSTTCSRCGTVCHENPIVSDLSFGETASGGAMVQGAMVGADQSRATLPGRQNALDSREQTLLTGRKNIKDLAAALRIPDYVADAAGGWFKLALSQNFVQGRRSQNVTAACLYVACRKEKTHHMLIDFSSKLQISVFSLGATFLKMVKVLNIVKLPLADPSLFISHFAENLNFDKERENGKIKVIRDAIKLAQRMSDDWIHEGRRPAGIAGACVLLAARMNNFRRTHAEIVQVAHVAEDTLQKRLNEFKKTKSGNLSVKGFRESDKVEASNPPSFEKNRQLEKKIEAQLAQKTKALQKYVEMAKQVENRTDTGVARKRKRLATLHDDDDEEEEEDQVATGQEKAQRLRKIKNLIEEEQAAIDELNEKLADQKRRQGDQAPAAKGFESLNIANEDTEQVKASKYLKNMLVDCEISEPEIQVHIKRILKRHNKVITDSLYHNPSASTEKDYVELNRPRNLVKTLPRTSDMLQRVSSSAELNDNDLTPTEEESYLADPEMIKMKERIWVSNNRDYLIEQEKKRLKLETDELAGNTSGRKKRRSTPKPQTVPKTLEEMGVGEALHSIGIDETTGESLSAADSARRMLATRNLSKKLNYDTLNGLFNTQ